MISLLTSAEERVGRRKTLLGIPLTLLLLLVITLLSLALHLANLDAIGDANSYYTVAVKSMLGSWHNFFFAAAEPGGSVTVDKPPLGLWIEAAFAQVLGVSGVSTSLPNILAGVLGVPLLYCLVRRHWGELAGLVAGLTLAITPVVIATDRNNTMDGMLVFLLLLAAWAFIKATERGKLPWLLLGGTLVGMGFNIKMLQAFLPLPAFYALYLFGSRKGWLRKGLDLLLTSVVLLAVALSWAAIVDLTPADQRPYVGSSQDNTVMELIVGHNGLSRLLSPRTANGAANLSPKGGGGGQGFPLGPGGQLIPPPRPGLGSPGTGSLPGQGAQSRPDAFLPPGGLADGPSLSPFDGPPGGGTPFSQETGTPGLTRFFTEPLSKQMSWLLPFGLISMLLLAGGTRVKLPLARGHQALVLWGGWLLICLVFFSAVEGIFHAYYVVMLAPALGALVGGGFERLWQRGGGRRWVHWILALAVGITVGFQIFSALMYGVTSGWITLPALLLAFGVSLLIFTDLRPAAHMILLASMLIIPLTWSVLTVLDDSPNLNLPTAYSPLEEDRSPRMTAAEDWDGATTDPDLISFLQANTGDVEYLVAVPNAHIGAHLVLETGRSVLYMGGFSGSDPVVDAVGLAEMVADGELRFVLMDGRRAGQGEITEWLNSSCTVVPQYSRGTTNPIPTSVLSGRLLRPGSQGSILYQCDP